MYRVIKVLNNNGILVLDMPTVRSRSFWETGSASDIVWESE